jgi:hypothetical protein
MIQRPPPAPSPSSPRPRRSNVGMLARRATELMDVLLERQAQLTGAGAGQAYVRLMSRLEDVLLVGGQGGGGGLGRRKGPCTADGQVGWA